MWLVGVDHRRVRIVATGTAVESSDLMSDERWLGAVRRDRGRDRVERGGHRLDVPSLPSSLVASHDHPCGGAPGGLTLSPPGLRPDPLGYGVVVRIASMARVVCAHSAERRWLQLPDDPADPQMCRRRGCASPGSLGSSSHSENWTRTPDVGRTGSSGATPCVRSWPVDPGFHCRVLSVRTSSRPVCGAADYTAVNRAIRSRLLGSALPMRERIRLPSEHTACPHPDASGWCSRDRIVRTQTSGLAIRRHWGSCLRGQSKLGGRLRSSRAAVSAGADHAQ